MHTTRKLRIARWAVGLVGLAYCVAAGTQIVRSLGDPGADVPLSGMVVAPIILIGVAAMWRLRREERRRSEGTVRSR